MKELELMSEVEDLAEQDLKNYITQRAELIVKNTQGDDWDDPEDWQLEAAEMAHAVMRFFRQK